MPTDRYKRIALPTRLTRVAIAAAALQNKTLIDYVHYRLSPIVNAIILLQDAHYAGEAEKAKARALLKRAERGPVFSPQGEKPLAIMFDPGFYGRVTYAAQLDNVAAYEFLHRYLIPIAIKDLEDASARILQRYRVPAQVAG